MIGNKDATGVFCEACQDTTAIYTSHSYKIFDSEQGGLTLYNIQCLACLEQIEHGVMCQECKQRIILNEGQMAPNYSYCAECKKKIISEFGLPSDRSLFAAEVKRWFQENDLISYSEMWSMVRNISMAGSSTPSYIQTLYDNGIIDFYYPSDKKLYEAKLGSGVASMSGHFNSNDRFTWAWDEAVQDMVDKI